MGGGKAVVCGIDSEEFASVLGERPCVGMVGGTVYFRGKIDGYPADIRLKDLTDEDIAFLDNNMDEFLDPSVEQNFAVNYLIGNNGINLNH